MDGSHSLLFRSDSSFGTQMGPRLNLGPSTNKIRYFLHSVCLLKMPKRQPRDIVKIGEKSTPLACKTVYPGSIPGVASTNDFKSLAGFRIIRRTTSKARCGPAVDPF